MSSSGFQAEIENDPAIVSDLIKRNQTSIEELKQKSNRNQERIYLILF